MAVPYISDRPEWPNPCSSPQADAFVSRAATRVFSQPARADRPRRARLLAGLLPPAWHRLRRHPPDRAASGNVLAARSPGVRRLRRGLLHYLLAWMEAWRARPDAAGEPFAAAARPPPGQHPRPRQAWRGVGGTR